MKRGAPWANRVVGASDEGHNALSVDAQTLEVSSATGAIRLRPAHVHAALRRLAGIESHANARRFPLDADPIDLFDGSV